MSYRQFHCPLVLKTLRRFNKPMHAYEIGDACGLTRQSVWLVLWRLERRGYVKSTGVRQKKKYEPTAKRGMPKDMRGQSEGSRANLDSSPYNAGIAAMWNKREYTPKPVAKHALEQCWGWMPNSSFRGIDAENDSGFNTRGPVRPEEASRSALQRSNSSSSPATIKGDRGNQEAA